VSDLGQTPSQSIVDALRSDHQAIAELLDDAVSEPDADEAEAAREQLVMNLVRHFVAEEQYLYPALRDALPEGDALARAGLADDRACESLLKRLEDDDLTPAGLADTLAEVRAAFAEHVRRQDPQLTALAAECPPERLAELGEGVIGAEQLAPTRPRAFAPGSVRANKVVSFVEGYIDRVRDHYGHRGEDPDVR
jgi:hypothetical protein